MSRDNPTDARTLLRGLANNDQSWANIRDIVETWGQEEWGAFNMWIRMPKTNTISDFVRLCTLTAVRQVCLDLEDAGKQADVDE